MTGLTPLPFPEHSTSSKRFHGSPRILGPSWLHFPTLTASLLGVQIFWSVEMGYASPYLLSLGLSKSSMAMVFLAGPLSGLFMQPLIGVLADNSTSRFGRRRPYMLLGTILCVFGMLLLGYTRSIAAVFTGWDNSKNDSLTIMLAIIAIYIVDFSINAVQALDRALLVDTLPSSLQPKGNAWAAGMLGFGAVVGFFIGTVPLPTVFPFLGTTELQVLSIIVCLLLLSGQVTMAVCVKERVLIESNRASSNKLSAKRSSVFVREIRDLWNQAAALPRVIRQIFIIQFFAWIAWFPLLFYTTIYVGDLYKQSTPLSDLPPISGSSSSSSEESLKILINARDAEATRLGSLSLFYSSILSLFMNIVAPMFVTAAAAKRSSSVTRSYTARREGALGALGDEIGSARVGGSGGFSEDETRSGWRSHGEGGGWWSRIRVPEKLKVRLVSLWAISHFVLACCMLGTLFTNSVTGATLIITVTGFSWAITQWAPFTLLAEAILTEPDPTLTNIPGSIRLADRRTLTNEDDATGDTERDGFLPGDFSDSDSDGGSEDGTGAKGKTQISGSKANGNGVLGNFGARVSRVDVGPAAGEDDDERDEHGTGVGKPGGLSSKAGSILGLHNIFIVIPQFLVVGLSAIMFAVFDPAQAPKAGVMPPLPMPSSLLNTNTTSTNPSRERNRVAIKLIRHAIGTVARNIETARAAEAAGRDEKGGQSNSVVYVFRIGGIAALIAFILCWRLARELRHRTSTTSTSI